MRVLTASLLMCLTAACALEPPPPAAPPPGSGQPVAAVAPAPAPQPAVMVASVPVLPIPIPFARELGLVPQSARLTLSNFRFDLADVEAVITPYPDCGPHPDLTPLDMKVPLNGTWVIQAPAGPDVCWRLHLPPAPGARVAPEWGDWSRVYMWPGHSIDSQL